MGERRNTVADLGVRYLLTLISLRRFSANRVLCASWGGTVLGSESRRLRVPVVDMSRLCRSSSITRRRRPWPGQQGRSFQAAIDTLDR